MPGRLWIFRILFVVIQIFPLATLAQKDSIQTYEYTIKYSEDTTVEHKNSNEIIVELSKSIPKILEYTEYNFKYTIQTHLTFIGKVQKKEYNKYHIEINIKPQKPSGDVFYKTFDISGILLPTLTNFTIYVADKEGKRSLSFLHSGVPLNSSNAFSKKIMFTDTLSLASPVLNVQSVHFSYSDSSLMAFKAKTKYIDGYYNSEFILADLLEKYQSIDLSFTDLTKIYEIKLKEIEKSLAEISAKNYIETLGLYSNDPIDFINKYSSLSVKVKELRSKINSTLSSIDRAFYEKGLERLSVQDTTNAILYFKKSTISNPYFAPAFLQLARINFFKGELFASDENLINITTKLNPDQATLKQAIHLSDSLTEAFIKKGESYISAENYHEALKYLNEAKTFCTTVKVITCSETLMKDIAKAKYGIYSSFITVSQKAIDNSILDMANIYIVKAKDYQLENSTDIISSQEADILLEKLVTGLTSNGVSLNNQMLYDSALTVLQNVSDLCKKYAFKSCSEKLVPAMTAAKQGKYKALIKKAEAYIKTNDPEKAETIIAEAKKYQQENADVITVSVATDSLSGKMKEKFYQKYITDGISYLKIQEGINALRCFRAAKEMEKNYLVIRNNTLDSLIEASARPYIKDYIGKGLVNVWGNEPEKAQSISDTIKLLLKKHRLENDSALNASFCDLNKKIQELFCKHTTEKYNEYYRKAYQSVSLQKYNDAINYFQKCLTVSNSDTACNVDNSTAAKGLLKYKDAAKYQKMLSLSDSAALAGSFNAAIDKYFEAENFSSSLNLSDFGLTHITFEKYIALQNEAYILKASEYFYNKKNNTKTFACLDILRLQNRMDSNIISFQKNLAVNYCTEDFNNNNEIKASESLKNYPVSDSWYATFRKSYVACMKTLKKKK